MRLLAFGRVGGAACVAVAVSAVMASGAFASSIYLCVGEKTGQGVKSGGTTAPGSCPKVTEKQKVVYIPVALPKEAAEQEKLLSILPHIKYLAEGVGGKPTIQFSGVNVQILNGEGKTATTNGAGNLVIGYDEAFSKAQTGSHDLILGEEQQFTSYAGIIAGWRNTVEAPFASITAGESNFAKGNYSAVSGGELNTASGEASWVGAGAKNTASGTKASVSGGYKNTASGSRASIFGGKELTAPNEFEAIP
jgi:hypothetical protein